MTDKFEFSILFSGQVTFCAENSTAIEYAPLTDLDKFIITSHHSAPAQSPAGADAAAQEAVRAAVAAGPASASQAGAACDASSESAGAAAAGPAASPASEPDAALSAAIGPDCHVGSYAWVCCYESRITGGNDTDSSHHVSKATGAHEPGESYRLVSNRIRVINHTKWQQQSHSGDCTSDRTQGESHSNAKHEGDRYYCSAKHDGDSYYCNIPVIISIDDSDEHNMTLSSPDAAFADWLDKVNSEVLYKSIVQPVVERMVQESEGDFKPHRGPLRIARSARSTSADISPDSSSQSASGNSSVNDTSATTVRSSNCSLLLTDGISLQPLQKAGCGTTLAVAVADDGSGAGSGAGAGDEAAELYADAGEFLRSSKRVLFVIGSDFYRDLVAYCNNNDQGGGDKQSGIMAGDSKAGSQLKTLYSALEGICSRGRDAVCMVLWSEEEYSLICTGAEEYEQLPRQVNSVCSSDNDSNNDCQHFIRFIFGNAPQMASDLKKRLWMLNKTDGKPLNSYFEYDYWRFVKHSDRNILAVSYDESEGMRAMILSPELLNCSFSGHDIAVPMLFTSELDFYDLTSLSSFAIHTLSDYVALAWVRAPGVLSLFPELPGPVPDAVHVRPVSVPVEAVSCRDLAGFNWPDDMLWLQPVLDRLEPVNDIVDLGMLNDFFARITCNARISFNQVASQLRLYLLNQKYFNDSGLYVSIKITEFEWLDQGIDFVKAMARTGITADLLNHIVLKRNPATGKTAMAEIDDWLYEATINCTEDFSFSLIYYEFCYALDCLYKIFEPLFVYDDQAKHAERLRSPDMAPERLIASGSMNKLLNGYAKREGRSDRPEHFIGMESSLYEASHIAVPDAEFLMGNYHNIARATGNRTVVITLPVLKRLALARLSRVRAAATLAVRAQRALLELGEEVVYCLPDHMFTLALIDYQPRNTRTGVQSLPGVSCISTALLLQFSSTYADKGRDVVLYSGNRLTVSAANQAGVKTVFSGRAEQLFDRISEDPALPPQFCAGPDDISWRCLNELLWYECFDMDFSTIFDAFSYPFNGIMSMCERKEAVDEPLDELPFKLELYDAFDSDACKGSNDNAPSSATDCQKVSRYGDKAVLEILDKAGFSDYEILDPFYERIMCPDCLDNIWFFPEYGVFGDPIEFIIEERTEHIVWRMHTIGGLTVRYGDEGASPSYYARRFIERILFAGLRHVDQDDISPAMQLFIKQVAAVRCARKRFVKLVRSENIADCYKTKCKVRHARQVKKSKVRKAQSNKKSRSGQSKAGKSSKSSKAKQAQSNKGISNDKNKPCTESVAKQGQSGSEGSSGQSKAGKSSKASQAQSNSGVSQEEINAGKVVKVKQSKSSGGKFRSGRHCQETSLKQ